MFFLGILTKNNGFGFNFYLYFLHNNFELLFCSGIVKISERLKSALVQRLVMWRLVVI